MKRIIALFLFAFCSVELSGCAAGGHLNDPTANYEKYNAAELFHQAEMSAAREDFDASSHQLDALEALYPYRNREQRLLDSIYVNYKLGKDVLALAQCDLFNLEYPQSRHRDYALYMKGLINFETVGAYSLGPFFHADPALGSMRHYERAYAAFVMLVREFPGQNSYALNANYRLHFLRDIIARHQLSVARYYFKRGAYLAAANRASYVVSHLNGTSSVLEAVQIMRQAYALLGLHELSRSAQTILTSNHYDVRVGMKPYLDII